MAYDYFTDDELRCKCGCGRQEMNPDFMEGVLIPLRKKCDFPFVLSSAYRCPDHNNAVSSTGLDGPHTTGRAADIKANSRQKALILRCAVLMGLSRFGIARSFIHIDDLDENKAFSENVVWTY